MALNDMSCRASFFRIAVLLSLSSVLIPVPGRAEVSASRGDVVWNIPDSLIGRDFSLFVTVLETDFKPGREAKFGYPGDRFGPMILRFVMDRDHLVLQQAVSPYLYRVGSGTDRSRVRCPERGYMDMLRFPVLSSCKDGVEADMSEWLSDDYYFGLQPYSFLLRIGPVAEPAGRCSSVPEIFRRQGQVIIRRRLSYTALPLPGAPRDTTRWTVGTCLTLLPRDVMPPVYADWRVGYFSVPSVMPDPSVGTVGQVRAIRRFRNGVTFCIFPGFPERLLPLVRRAMQAWDKVFKEYGISGGVRLEEPSAEDMASGRYVIDDARISWIKYNDAPFNENAYGRAYTDLRTGEILCACIGVSSGVDRNIRRWYLTQTGDTGPVPEDVYMALFEMIVTHEAGHTLGLEHNFYGSRMFSTAELRDPSLMSKVSHGSSIMDYMRMNYAALPEDGIAPVDLVPGTGPYDRAAVLWGYGSADRDSLAALMFSRDSLRYLPPVPYDPQTLAEDLGSDPLSTAENGMRHLERACASLAGSFLDAGDSLFAAAAVKSHYSMLAEIAASFAGGRMRVPDRDGGIMTVPVDSTEQARALDFIERYVYEPPRWASDVVDSQMQEDIRSKVERNLARARSGAADICQETAPGCASAAGGSVLCGQDAVSGKEIDRKKRRSGFRVMERNGRVSVVTKKRGSFSVSVRIDCMAWQQDRPLSPPLSFSAEGTADITDSLYVILASESTFAGNGLRPVYDGSPFADARCFRDNGGWTVCVRTDCLYTPEYQVVEMLPRSGMVPAEVSFHISVNTDPCVTQ